MTYTEKMLLLGLKQYLKNFKAGIAFLVLLFFAPFLLFLQNTTFFSTGSFFLYFDLKNAGIASIALTVLLGLFEVVVYSVLVTILVMSVKQKILGRQPGFVRDKIKKFSFHLTVFYFLFLAIIYVAGAIFYFLQLPLWVFVLTGFLASLAFFYVPQSIIVDEYSLRHALEASFDFCMEKKKDVFTPLLIGALATILAVLFEFVLDTAFVELLPGRILSLVIVLGFVVPYTEILKTYFYMKKNALLKRTLD